MSETSENTTSYKQSGTNDAGQIETVCLRAYSMLEIVLLLSQVIENLRKQAKKPLFPSKIT